MNATSFVVRSTILPLSILSCLNSPAALKFDGSNDYVTLGTSTSLGVTNFTIECWFKRTGPGVTISTGTGGITALPLVTKGRGENEAGVTNMNYFLGVATNNMLSADFEDKNDGLNHPVIASNTAAASNAWQHAAVTYSVSSSNWVVYLNGLPIATNTVSGTALVRTPEGNSIQHAALGSALTTVGTAAGYFNGSLEEVRIWNYARTAQQIATNKNLRIISASGLIGRWPLTETNGTLASDTSGSGIHGTLLNGPVWTNDSPFPPPSQTGFIGNTNAATLTDSLWSSGAWINSCRFQAASNMTVSTMYARVTAISGHYKCAIYSDSSSQPNRLLRATAEVSNPGAGWQTFPLTTPLALTNGIYYWLAIWSDDSNAQIYYSDTSGTLRWGQYNYGTWPNPIATTGGSSMKYCIYAVGTASPTLVSIAVTPANPTILAGNTQQFTATGNFSDGSAQNLTSLVTWNSSSTATATINSSGLATGVAGGTTTISATLGGVSGNTLLTVQPASLSVTTTSLPDGVTNVAYSATLTAMGGTPPYTWSLPSGSLPAGLTLNTNSGVISGIPTAIGVSTFTAGVKDNVGASNTSGALTISILSSLPPGTNLVFNFANVWRYQQLTNLDGTNWKLKSYDDTFWPAGAGLLAYETCGCLPQPTGTTLVTNQSSLTYYFRTHFNFAGNPADVSLVLSNVIDDGAVFYLNGVEIARVNMPAGTVTYTTPASTTVSDATNYTVLNISGNLLTNLVAGDNVLAVEVHQINSTSTDIVFGSSLSTVSLQQVQYVIVISVDGMGSAYVAPLLTPGLANELTTFKRFQAEGSGTLNARDDADYAVTLPNHVTMMTSRGVNGASGHGWTLNDYPDGTATTLELKKGSYVASGFDVAHDNGLRTGIWAGKSKFNLFQQSYSATSGAEDITGPDNGRDKIDYDSVVNSIEAATLTADFTNQMTASAFNFVFLHYQDPDTTGHSSGWSTDPASAFATTLKSVDTQIGKIMQMVENSPVLQGKTAIILTTDHGGHGKTHGDTGNSLDYTIPFYVWGPGVTAGGDLYAMNPTTRTAPGADSNPPYTGSQPIRNGDSANLALALLGLEPVPGSTIGSGTNKLAIGTGVNSPPVASNGMMQVNADAATGIVLPATDPNGDALTFSLVGLPAHGLLSGFNATSGAVTYTPAHGYSGNDTVSFTASDGSLTSSVAVVTLVVQPLADGNGNGLPDAWEVMYVLWDPNADPDHDGLTNLQEYWANTNPTNAASLLRLTSVAVATNRNATVSWQAVGGTRYRVSYTDGGSSGGLPGVFTPIVRPVELEMNTAPVGTATIQSFVDDFTLTGGAPTNGARYYRINVVQ